MASVAKVVTKVRGGQGLELPAQGLGCMGMTGVYGKAKPEEQCVATIKRALELGVTLFDTADFYPGRNLEVLALGIEGQREKAIISSKFGAWFNASGSGVAADPNSVRAACEETLKRLGTNYIDLFTLARVDPKTPIETTVGAMAALRAEGKIRHLGLSEASAATIRRAHQVHPIAVVQIEWSVWERSVEAEIIPTCRELGIAVIAYSPLGRGFFSGSFKPGQSNEGDYRALAMPRFEKENLEKNMVLYENVERLAKKKGVLPGQLALAWVQHRGEDVIPIPGTTSVHHLEDNVAALDIELTPEELSELEEAVPVHKVVGKRYNAHGMSLTHEGQADNLPV